MRTCSNPADSALRSQLALSQTLPRRVYVSPAAVAALAELDPAQLQLPSAAVGASTAAALSVADCESVWAAPERPGIDGLFALEQWHSLAGSGVALFCAAGGRRPDPDRLRQLRLELCAVEVYRREFLAPSPEFIHRLRKDWSNVVFSATSVDLLGQLDRSVVSAGLTAARARPLLVLSQRIAAAAGQLGYTDVRLITHLQAEPVRAALAVSQSRG